MAGITALLDQKLGTAQGNLNPGLYQMLSGAPDAFHDVTLASSGVASCDLNTPSMCNNSIGGPTGLTGSQPGYAIGTGYDEATGLGSLDAAKFVNAIAGSLVVPSVTVTPGAFAIHATQPLSVTVTLAAASGDPAPTGTARLVIDSYTSAATSLSGGSATIVVPALSLPASINDYVITAEYQPDAAGSAYYRAATGTSTVNVNFIDPIITVGASSNSITTAQNVTVTAQVDGGGTPTPTGTVEFDLLLLGGTGLYDASAPVSAGTATIVIPPGLLPPGQNAISAMYTPDAQASVIYARAANANQVNISVTQVPKTTPTVTVLPGETSLTSLQSLTVNVAVTGAVTANGNVALTCGSFTSGPANLVNGAASIVVPAGVLPAGVDTLTVSYGGDLNNNAASGMATVTVTAPER